MDYTCQTCHAPVRAGDAFVRSASFRPVAWCGPCWRARHAALAMPAQRTPEEQPATTATLPQQRSASVSERVERRWFSRL